MRGTVDLLHGSPDEPGRKFWCSDTPPVGGLGRVPRLGRDHARGQSYRTSGLLRALWRLLGGLAPL